ncbi:Ribosomal RNA small subunit methyltransferase F [Symbiodinium microadriaticum]|uniref:Ribosomal RNA small subunit methyltransferase F n=1 Tax=Symbiodinium microadriaticum TaxID=2951 RepID=A0A1Q9EKD4_SYMMI|nr:Ribosomal RNA small subunit methyltransferase F [Symbiodinium microadriaticum]
MPDDSEINKPIWHSHPDVLPPSEAQDAVDERGYASYVAGEVENDTKKPKVLDYFSTTSAYCFNDEKFRPIRSMEPGASRSPKASVDNEIEIEIDRTGARRGQAAPREKEAKAREVEAEPAPAKRPVKPKNELKAWEDEKDAASTASVLGDIVSGAAVTLGLEQVPDKAAKDREALNKLVQAKAQRPAAPLTEHAGEDATSQCQAQSELLRSAWLALRPGGVLVYSTCTLNAFENENQSRSLLDYFPDAELQSGLGCQLGLAELESPDGFFRVWPHKLNVEGFFVACFRKKAEEGGGGVPQRKGSELWPQFQRLPETEASALRARAIKDLGSFPSSAPLLRERHQGDVWLCAFPCWPPPAAFARLSSLVQPGIRIVDANGALTSEIRLVVGGSSLTSEEWLELHEKAGGGLGAKSLALRGLGAAGARRSLEVDFGDQCDVLAAGDGSHKGVVETEEVSAHGPDLMPSLMPVRGSLALSAPLVLRRSCFGDGSSTEAPSERIVADEPNESSSELHDSVLDAA